jgi:hypothetical protein
MMDMCPDDLDIESWRRAYRDFQGPGSASCPPDDHMIVLVLHEQPCTERGQLADHIVSCRRCTDLYRILVHVHRGLTGGHDDTVPLGSGVAPEMTEQRSGERGDQEAQAASERLARPPHQR